MKYLKSKLKYKKVVLCGWSGGGSLSTYYQAEAEAPTVTTLPSGEAFVIKHMGLLPADGLMLLAAHTSRARIFTEWMDPAVQNESDTRQRDASLDLFGLTQGDVQTAVSPPFEKNFIDRYRAAQSDRNRRITAWVKARLEQIDTERSQEKRESWRRMQRDEGFVVHCTQADPRRLDLSLDPSDREVSTIGDSSP